MLVQLEKFLKKPVSIRLFVIGLIVLCVLLVTSGFVWMQTDQTIAPPGLRVMDALWRMFFF